MTHYSDKYEKTNIEIEEIIDCIHIYYFRLINLGYLVDEKEKLAFFSLIKRAKETFRNQNDLKYINSIDNLISSYENRNLN
jgi:hypothetical protein